MPDKLLHARHAAADVSDRATKERSEKPFRPRHAHKETPSQALSEVPLPESIPEGPLDLVPEEGIDLEEELIDVRSTDEGIASSTYIMSICVLVSRITGFARTWAMAYALGATFISSSYQVANNLPNMLYELVMGGMLVTAFLPVYVSVKKKLGARAGNEYASNLMTLVIILLGIVSLLGILWPQVVIYTQSFYSDQESMGVAIFLFQFFAIQTVFYGCSSILSGLLNANRDYFWSSAAPIMNNLIVIATFIAYAFIAPDHPNEALYVIAIGNPLGVAAQMLFQVPALKRNGIRLCPRINFHDPALKETISLGVSALFITLFSFITVSVMNAASYAFADNGPSVIVYARLWYTLPYSFLAIPITTALFTELSHLKADENWKGFKACVVKGTSEITFLLLPFMLYLMVFATPLISLYHIGAFSDDAIQEIAGYLVALAVALPFYGLSTFTQKVFSSLRKMGTYAIFNAIAGIIQVILTLLFVELHRSGAAIPIGSIALASAAFYVIVDALSYFYLKKRFGHIGIKAFLRAGVLGLVLGGLGALAGAGVLFALQMFIAPLDGSILRSLLYVCAGGIVSLIVTFGIAYAAKLPESALINKVLDRMLHR